MKTETRISPSLLPGLNIYIFEEIVCYSKMKTSIMFSLFFDNICQSTEVFNCEK